MSVFKNFAYIMTAITNSWLQKALLTIDPESTEGDKLRDGFPDAFSTMQLLIHKSTIAAINRLLIEAQGKDDLEEFPLEKILEGHYPLLVIDYRENSPAINHLTKERMPEIIEEPGEEFEYQQKLWVQVQMYDRFGTKTLYYIPKNYVG